MTPGQSKIIARLRQGPLDAKDFQAVGAASENTLKVQVHKLREQGFDIQTVNPDGQPWSLGGAPGRRGSPPGRYVLSEEAPGEVEGAVNHLTARLTKPGAFRIDDEPHLRTILAALASPPSERERELEGALEPFAAFARVVEAKSRMALGEVLSDDKILASISWEGGLGVLVTGHFRDALTAVPNPKGWGGLYRRALTAQPAGEPTHG